MGISGNGDKGGNSDPGNSIVYRVPILRLYRPIGGP